MPSRAVTLYWKTLQQVRITRDYMRLYRDSLDRWTTRIAIGRAATGTAALGAWAIVKDYPLVWGGIIAAVQVAESIQRATSLAARLRQTQAMLAALEEIVNQSARQWEDVRRGELDETEILDAQLKVAEALRKADARHLPNGLHQRPKLFRLAEATAKTYLLTTYGTLNDDVSHETLPSRPNMEPELAALETPSLPLGSLDLPVPPGVSPPRVDPVTIPRELNPQGELALPGDLHLHVADRAGGVLAVSGAVYGADFMRYGTIGAFAEGVVPSIFARHQPVIRSP